MTTQTAVQVGQGWTLVYDAGLLGPFVGTVNLVTSDSPQYRVGTSLPDQTDVGFQRGRSFKIGLSQLRGEKLYARSMDGSATLVLDDTTAPDSYPMGMFTSSPDAEGFGRLQVDVGQTSFFEGREFRTFKEFGTPTTGSYLIRAEIPINIILWSLGVQVEEGAVRVETLSGGTSAGPFPDTLPVVPANGMTERPTPFYTPQVVLTGGSAATLVGGTLLDVLRAKTSGNTNFASSVGAETASERGVGPATAWLRITLTAAIAVFKARWEER